MTINQEEEEEYPHCLACGTPIPAETPCHQISEGHFDYAERFHTQLGTFNYLCTECHARLLEEAR